MLKHLGFKGGTMLRKMVFGPRGRLLSRLIERVVSGYRFLGDLTELERLVAADVAGHRQDLASRLGVELQQCEAFHSSGPG